MGKGYEWYDTKVPLPTGVYRSSITVLEEKGEKKRRTREYLKIAGMNFQILSNAAPLRNGT